MGELTTLTSEEYELLLHQTLLFISSTTSWGVREDCQIHLMDRGGNATSTFVEDSII